MPTRGESTTARNPGLDLFRTLAILLVLVSHGRHFLTGYTVPGWDWWWLSVGGYLGVELFFVLSGFLIGQILVRDVWVQSAQPWSDRLRLFLIRRWFRTLPMYYLVLLYTVASERNHGANPWVDYRHFFFLQNFHAPSLEYFGVSWSLAIEEWFYVCIPAGGCLFLRAVTRKSGAGSTTSLLGPIAAFLFAIILLALAGTVAHLIALPDLSWTLVRKSVFLRFDSFAIGILLALFQRYRPAWFVWLAGPLVSGLSAVGLVALIGFYYREGDRGLDTSTFARTGMFTLTSVCVAGLMLYVHRAFRWESRVVEWGSRLTYGIYLVHSFIFWPLAGLSGQYATPWVSVALLGLAFLGTSLTAYVLYRFFEKPMMDLRNGFSFPRQPAAP